MLTDVEAKLFASLSEEESATGSNGCTGPLRSARLDRANTNLAHPTLRETLTASPRVEVCDARIESRRVTVSSLRSFRHCVAIFYEIVTSSCRSSWMTVDPYMRGRMVDRASYVPPFQLGEPLQGGAIGEVVASNDPRLKRGDHVSTMFGWRELFNAPAANLAEARRPLGCHPRPSWVLPACRPDGLGGPVEDRGAEAWRCGVCLSRGRRGRLRSCQIAKITAGAKCSFTSSPRTQRSMAHHRFRPSIVMR